MNKQRASGIYYCLIAALLFAACGRAPAPGTVKDEALTVGRMADSFPAADENYFKEMDGGVDHLVSSERQTSQPGYALEISRSGERTLL
jgi:hypothetical protein